MVKLIFRIAVIILVGLLIESCSKDNSVESEQPDYFPIKVGTSMKYKYSSSATNIVYTFQDIGDAEWNISSVKEIDGSQVCSTTEIKTVMSSKNGNTPTQKVIRTLFEIVEDKSNLLTLKGLIGVSFHRYRNDDKIDGRKIIILDGGYIEVEKNIGITKIMRLGSKWSETYVLIR